LAYNERSLLTRSFFEVTVTRRFLFSVLSLAKRSSNPRKPQFHSLQNCNEILPPLLV